MFERPCHLVALNAYIFIGIPHLLDANHLGLICVFEQSRVWHFVEVEPRQRDPTVVRNARFRNGRVRLSIIGAAHLAVLGTARIG